jgi:hypothetical protein
MTACMGCFGFASSLLISFVGTSQPCLATNKAPLIKQDDFEKCHWILPVTKGNLNIIASTNRFYCYVHDTVVTSEIVGFLDSERIPIPELKVLNLEELTDEIRRGYKHQPKFAVKFTVLNDAPYASLVTLFDLMKIAGVQRYAMVRSA